MSGGAWSIVPLRATINPPPAARRCLPRKERGTRRPFSIGITNSWVSTCWDLKRRDPTLTTYASRPSLGLLLRHPPKTLPAARHTPRPPPSSRRPPHPNLSRNLPGDIAVRITPCHETSSLRKRCRCLCVAVTGKLCCESLFGGASLTTY
ncbi:hypothetical protein E2C01_068778 [Portunus trituberculatus]|uniref:Uncharacterized protein n=1 Tax=Portunus trituberculatus TaxID=210409 RepID=A0A5B7HNA5_PORTR|nr:hypothetical protein [Portunus trituberculatus]